MDVPFSGFFFSLWHPFSLSSAEGLCKEDSSGTYRDEMVIYGVMAAGLDEGRWVEYRGGHEARLRREQVVVRAQ
jgi:hypothetical protein